MNHCAIQQNSFAACDEIWATAGRSGENRGTVICPKPRRIRLVQTTLEPSYSRSLRLYVSHQQEDYDSKTGNELMNIILAKGKCVSDQSVPHVASSPPFFSGSPPSRVSNPLIQDARFGDEKYSSMSPRSIVTTMPSGTAPSPSSTRKGGCVRENFGNNPSVRIEGFDCLDRDRRNCSIPTLA